MINRRLFGQALLGAGAFAGLPPWAHAVETEADSTLAEFNANRPLHPWLIGYEGLTEDQPPMPLVVRGRMPSALKGAFYRNGPARHSLGSIRYHHAFDGDGMLQKYEIGERGIVHKARFVRTEKFLADSAAGRPVRPAFGTNPPDVEPIKSADAMNVANTSVVSHGGELMALWEGGSATRMDPQSLQTLGLKTWKSDYAGMPFSAHPKIEADGTLWNFGVSSHAGLLSIYRVAPTGRLLKAASIEVPQIAMVHDFAVTSGHLVFLLPPLVFDIERARAGETFLDSHVWQPQLGLRVLVIDKNDLAAQRWFELPAGFVFHIGNAWEDAQTLRLDCMRADDASGVTWSLRELMKGRHDRAVYAQAALIALDLRSGRASQSVLPHAAEFPRVDPRVVGQRYRAIYAVERLNPGDRPGYDAVMRLDIDSGEVDRYRYGPDVMVEEHVFVPNRHGRGAEGDGWLVGTALDLRRRAMLFCVFNARRLADGPIVQALMPRVMPLGLHGIFVPA